ncbi:prolipoprotein diacylglyceryl transferase [Paenibacillus lycopersici]|uniref:Phosphatidylglycerol--prolipoprotein diacylglyceryl transferase n=1 Tax=Paenibacillus lycopersici TaxID=2704462 RepID=A0A6C0FXG2_9BACL|nr:prolipoprotein diacylglyceryl transferase [Paenibacillus lycopersici]QHT58890.1 prolipoprotein diacylglyceryl transferase [Paenibacillus lycopersici]
MFGLRLDPIAFSLGSINVHWYGIILGTAALVGLLLAVQEGKRFGLSPDFFMDLLLFGVPSAIIGARIYFVAFQWNEYKHHLMDVFKIWNGGIAIYGALIGAFACGIIYFRKKGYSFWRVADICAPSLIAGQMIGRWGNFVNQEAYGGEVSENFLRHTLHLPNWIVNQMNVEGIYHHPTFLYESLWNLLGLVIFFILRRRPFLRAGELLFAYFIWYSLGRFYVEGLRTDSLAFRGADWAASLLNGIWSPMKAFGFKQGFLDQTYGNIRVSQLLAVLLIIVSIAMIFIRRRSGAASERYNDPIINFKTGRPAGAEESARASAQSDDKPLEHSSGDSVDGAGNSGIKE